MAEIGAAERYGVIFATDPVGVDIDSVFTDAESASAYPAIWAAENQFFRKRWDPSWG